MVGAGWKDVGDLVVKIVTREPPFVQILYVLGAGFTAVMILEGIRVNFLPARKHRASSRAPSRRVDAGLADAMEMPYADSAAVTAELPSQSRQQILRSRKAGSSSGKTNSGQASRPKIRRMLSPRLLEDSVDPTAERGYRE